MLVDVYRLQLHPSRRSRTPPRPSAALLELTHRHGPLQPVLARPLVDRRFEILGNVESWLAAQFCGHHQVPVEVLDGIGEDEALEILDGHQNLGPLGEARRYARLVDIERAIRPHGAVSRVARQCGVGRTRVAHALRLLTLPEILQEALRIGAITAGHARVLLSCSERTVQADIGARVIGQRLSVRATEEAVRASRAGRSGVSPPGAQGTTPASARSPDIARLENRISSQIGSPVTVDETAGTLTIDYRRSLEVFEGILERLGVTLD